MLEEPVLPSTPRFEQAKAAYVPHLRGPACTGELPSPVIVHVASGASCSSTAAVSFRAQLITNWLTIAIRGALPQSDGREISMERCYGRRRLCG